MFKMTFYIKKEKLQSSARLSSTIPDVRWMETG